MSLRNMLLELYNQVEVLAYQTLDDFIRDSNRHFIQFFVNEDILFSNIDEFETLKSQTSVISTNPAKHFKEAGFNVLDLSSSEKEIVGKLLHLQFMDQKGILMNTGRKGAKNRLSEREKEVLKLMIKGHINKEIAQALDISLPTAIFHRNNICDKLQTRSIGRMTVYAVLSGIIDINEI